MYPFTEGSFAPKDGWYVAAFPHEITRTLLTRWILNEPVVLYRKEDGTAVAVNGRCPHRHFPLGESRLVGDAIQCGYHGITFGPDGRCTAVPSQSNIPNVYRIRNYPLVEQGLWMWIWPGDPALADESLIPSPEEIGLTEEGIVARPFYSELVKGRYQLLNDNLLDLSHLGYLHGSSIGTEENASVPEERDITERRLRSRRTMNGASFPDVMTHVTDYRGGQALNEGKVWHAVTPSTHDETLYFFAMGARENDKLDFMFEYLKPVVGEDVFATEEIEKILKRMGTVPPELILKSDATAVQGRRMLQAMMDKEKARLAKAA